MADHKVTIQPGYVLDPPAIGGPTDPIRKGDTVTFTNQEGDACVLHFDSPSPFGKPTIGPIPNKGSQSPEVTATVKNRQSFPYTCEPAIAVSTPNTASASTMVAASGSTLGGSTAAAGASTTSVLDDSPDQGIIIVDPPGGGS